MKTESELKEKYAHLLVQETPSEITDLGEFPPSALSPLISTETTKNKMQKYHLATYGCQMNVYDSNMVASSLERNGMSSTENIAEADLVIVNTCSIRGGAEDRAYARIAAMRYHKRQNPHLKIAVIGCMAQNHGDKIPVDLSHVDIVAGPDSYRDLEKVLFEKKTPEIKDIDINDVKIKKKKKKEKQILTTLNKEENYSGYTAKINSSYSSFVTIMRGCDKHCSYCIVPLVRGKEKSREPKAVIEEIEEAAKRGVTEITLLGQTVNSYRVPGTKFADLLRNVNAIEGIRRIRFTSPHPRHFDAETIAAMAECPKICNHMHLPLQSGSNRILKEMRRQYTREKFMEILADLRAAVPNMAITTDIITGYVGETEEDFQETLSLVKEARFDHAFMFSYSPREGTPAYALTETLSEEEKSRRLEDLIYLQNTITFEKTQESVGRTEEILLEGPSHKSDADWIGKTRCFKKVIVPYTSDMFIGKYIQAEITASRGMTLTGRVVT